jgi:hypothetical protein
MMLYNLHRYVQHVGTCCDPTCGSVICIDGNEKVSRKICGESLDLPSADTGYNPKASDVHNAVSRAIMREKVCGNAPTRGGRDVCKACKDQPSAMEDVPADHGSPRKTRTCTIRQTSHEATPSEVSRGVTHEDKQVNNIFSGDLYQGFYLLPAAG